MAQCVALIRGINVGRAKRVSMADLREIIEGLGFTKVRTVLNSGNVVFDATRPNPTKIAGQVEKAIVEHCGFSASVIVVTAAELEAVVTGNLLPGAVHEPSKFLVAFAASATTLGKAKPLLAETWEPDCLAIGKQVAYLWCTNGILESKLLKAFSRATADAITTRNWATVLKLQAAIADGKNLT